jgi:hypothetical protein
MNVGVYIIQSNQHTIGVQTCNWPRLQSSHSGQDTVNVHLNMWPMALE